MVRKIRFLIVTLAAVLLSVTAFAENDIAVMLDGTPLSFDVPPVISEDRTFVPMRAIFEAFDCDVEWLSDEQVVIATKDSKMIMLKIGNKRLIVSDIFSGETKTFETDAAPFIENGRTLVPIRYISEALSCSVDWNGETRTVSITK